MKLVPTLIKNFKDCEFKHGIMYFQYGNSLYNIWSVTERHVKYGTNGDNRSKGVLSDVTSYKILSVSIKNSLRGPQIVFKIDS